MKIRIRKEEEITNLRASIIGILSMFSIVVLFIGILHFIEWRTPTPEFYRALLITVVPLYFTIFIIEK